MARPKRERQQFPVYFTPAERALLKQIAEKDKRDEGGEIRWLVEAYASGVIVLAGTRRVIESRAERALGEEVVYGGEVELGSVSVKPKPPPMPALSEDAGTAKKRRRKSV